MVSRLSAHCHKHSETRKHDKAYKAYQRYRRAITTILIILNAQVVQHFKKGGGGGQYLEPKL